MTATDELRRMLDEYKVKWMPSVFDPQHETFYSVDNGVGFIVTEFPEIGRMSLACDMRITPEQVIAATLGAGTCELEEVEKDCDTASEYMLDREWCFDAVYKCSCGCRFGHVAHDRPHYCPNCGRKVVDE